MLLSRHTQRRGLYDAGNAEVRLGVKASGGGQRAIAEAEEEGADKGAGHRGPESEGNCSAGGLEEIG